MKHLITAILISLSSLTMAQDYRTQVQKQCKAAKVEYRETPRELRTDSLKDWKKEECREHRRYITTGILTMMMLSTDPYYPYYYAPYPATTTIIINQ